MSQDINLALIDRDPGQPRQHFDADKLAELAQSMQEKGLIQTIMVRPTEAGRYAIVHGERRFRAAKALGWPAIRAEVREVTPEEARWLALIENVQREDMEPMDVARALKALKDETEWSNLELGRRGIMEVTRVGQLLALLETPSEVQKLVARASGGEVPEGKITEAHVREARRAAKGVDAVYTPSLQKAAREGLTSKETRIVAEAVRDAPNEAVKQALLDTPVRRDVEYWKEAGSIAASDREQERAETYAMAPAVKDLLEIFKIARRILGRGKDSMDLGKMGPEHMPYIATQARKLAAWLSTWADELDTLREEIING